MKSTQQDDWTCPHCHTNDVSFYGEFGFCNKCLRVWKSSVIYDDLELK